MLDYKYSSSRSTREHNVSVTPGMNRHVTMFWESMCSYIVCCLTCGKCTTSDVKRAVCIVLFLASIWLQIIGIIIGRGTHWTLDWAPVLVNLCVVLPFTLQKKDRKKEIKKEVPKTLDVWFNLNKNGVFLWYSVFPICGYLYLAIECRSTKL